MDKLHQSIKSVSTGLLLSCYYISFPLFKRKTVTVQLNHLQNENDTFLAAFDTL